MAGEEEDPMSLASGVLAILTDHENAARHGGLHAHTMRRQLETIVAAYETAVALGDAVAIAEAEGAVGRRAAEFMVQLAQASIRLLEEEANRRPS